MKNIIYYSLLLILISCRGEKEETSIELGLNKQSESLANCNCDSLLENEQNHLLLDGEKFTGLCFLNYPTSDQKYIEKQIFNGSVHGKITYYDKNGDILFDESYSEGELLSNTEIESHCNCKDLKMKASSDKLTKNYLNTILFSGSCEDYYPNSDQIYLEANYKKGLLHGFTIHYTKNGSAILMQKYEEGILIEEIIPQ